MTGVKMNNEVLSMSADTVARDPVADANGNKLANDCGSGNGHLIGGIGAARIDVQRAELRESLLR